MTDLHETPANVASTHLFQLNLLELPEALIIIPSMGLLVDLTTQTPWPTLQLLLPAPLPCHSPCIALYEVDIPCAYKVSFRLPLCTPTMGDRAVFCARNMPLDLEHDFIQRWFIPGWFPTRKRLVICGNALFDRWFPSKNGLNMSHHPLERNMSPQ